MAGSRGQQGHIASRAQNGEYECRVRIRRPLRASRRSRPTLERTTAGPRATVRIGRAFLRAGVREPGVDHHVEDLASGEDLPVVVQGYARRTRVEELIDAVTASVEASAQFGGTEGSS